ALRRHEIGEAALADDMGHLHARVQRRAENFGILRDPERFGGGVLLAACERHELALAGFLREGGRFPAGRDALAVRLDPDLEDAGVLIFEVPLLMLDAAARRHDLNV